MSMRSQMMESRGPVTHPGTAVRAHIDAAALRHNVRVLAQRVHPAALMSVVKADAYGHGVATVVRACLDAGVTDFGVATVPEALELSDLLGTDPQVRKPRILCWLYDARTDLTECVRRGIELGLASAVGLEQILAAGAPAGRAVRVHIKVDSGLGRNGFTLQQLEEVLPRLRRTASEHPGRFVICGLMTHLASADERDESETSAQLAALNRAEEMIRSLLEEHRSGADFGLGDPADLIVHCANSPGALWLDPVPGGMARVGLSTYGLSPFDDLDAAALDLRPVMSVRSSILTTKLVPAGHGASYGLTYRCEEATRFGLVAGGYADGIPRAASGSAQVSVHGVRYPVVGRIAMDQMIIDLGPDPADGPVVEIGDEVVILGDGSTGPSAEEWGAWSASINYEVVTRIGPRVLRVVDDADEACAEDSCAVGTRAADTGSAGSADAATEPGGGA